MVECLSKSELCPVVASVNRDKSIYTVQFHPEVTNSEYGNEILKNFVFKVCNAKANWSMASFIDTEIKN